MPDASTPGSTPAPTPAGNPSPPEGAKVEGQTGEKPTETKKAKQFVDVDGEIVDLEQLKRERKKYLGADKSLRESSQMKKEAEALYEQLENDPDSVFSNPRLSAKKEELAMKWLRQKVEAELNPPDPRDAKLTETEKKLKAYEEKEAGEKDAQQKAEYSKVVESRKEAIAQTLTKALEATPLSKNPKVQAEVIAEMAKYMRLARNDGREVSVEELVAHVQDGRMSSYQSLAQNLEGDELISWLGDAIVTKIRKADLTRLRGSPTPPDTADENSWQSRNTDSKKREFVDPQSLRRRS